MHSVEIDLDDERDLVRVAGGDRAEEGADELRHRLERHDDLSGLYDRLAPPIARVARGPIGARRETGSKDPSALALRRPGIGVGRDHEAHRTARIGGLHRVRAHCGPPARSVTFGPIASRVTSVESRDGWARSTIAARPGTGEMLRMRWYSVSPCQVDTFRRSTPWY